MLLWLLTRPLAGVRVVFPTRIFGLAGGGGRLQAVCCSYSAREHSSTSALLPPAWVEEGQERFQFTPTFIRCFTRNEKNINPAADIQGRRRINKGPGHIHYLGRTQTEHGRNQRQDCETTIEITCQRNTPTFWGAGKPNPQSRDTFNMSKVPPFPLGEKSCSRDGAAAPLQD